MNTPSEQAPGRSNSILSIVIILVIIGFTWRSCWYATPLSDSDMEQLLSGDGSDSRIHKALSQFKERLDKNEDVTRWYPLVIKLSDHKTAQIRSTAAWAMGGAPKHEAFLTTLKTMLDDKELQVRYNAAVSLGAAGQGEARGVLRQMLAVHTVTAPSDGTMQQPRRQGESLRFGQIIGRVKDSENKVTDILAPLVGRLSQVKKRHGAEIKAGEDLFVIEPEAGQILNAMIALARCGEKEDAPALQPIKEGRFGVDEPTRQRAAEIIGILEAK